MLVDSISENLKINSHEILKNNDKEIDSVENTNSHIKIYINEIQEFYERFIDEYWDKRPRKRVTKKYKKALVQWKAERGEFLKQIIEINEKYKQKGFIVPGEMRGSSKTLTNTTIT